MFKIVETYEGNVTDVIYEDEFLPNVIIPYITGDIKDNFKANYIEELFIQKRFDKFKQLQELYLLISDIDRLLIEGFDLLKIQSMFNSIYKDEFDYKVELVLA